MSGTTATVGERRLVEAGVLLVAAVWASNFIVVKAANEVWSPILFAALRFSIAAIVLLALLRWREGSIGLPRGDLVAVARLGVLGFGMYQVLWATALVDIPAGDSAILIATTPILTALIAVLAGSDTLTPSKLAGALVSFAGVAVVVGGGAGLALDAPFLGYALTLGAAICWAVYNAFGASVLRRHSPLRTTAWAVAAGAVFLAVPASFLSGQVRWADVGPAPIAALLYSAILPAGLANVVAFHGVKLLGPTRITAFQYLVPAFAVLLAFLLLHEPIRPAQVAGGIVIILGVMLSRGAFGR